ncbi:MAG: hypothetical protein K6F05_03260 [Succinivibrio sp.]|nr:hypothetical protein [Succinivibrio sp.]
MEEFWSAVILGVVMGIILAVIVVNYMASGLKSVHIQTSADSYYDPNQLRFEDRSEIFIGSRLETVPKPRPQSRR